MEAGHGGAIFRVGFHRMAEAVHRGVMQRDGLSGEHGLDRRFRTEGFSRAAAVSVLAGSAAALPATVRDRPASRICRVFKHETTNEGASCNAARRPVRN
jgi:hypothetical protein